MTNAAPLPDSTAASPTLTLLSRIQADWARVRPDLDAQPMLTLLLLDRLHTALARHIELTYLDEGINASNWDLLLTLLRSAPPEGLTPTELSELSAITGASMTNRVARLLDKGLVERALNAVDRRSVRVRLSARGRKLVETLLSEHLAREARILSVLSPEEIALLTALSSKLVQQVEALGQGAAG
ncbi:MarR family winged helix-turn-helix transcriptional regulator [Deinococcus ruber]|uniref:MarR family transcriptional regulator n=1 Tax=Deinococcus ruber TaxID=1848197 RepID=A0A918CA95_9DEIO|nr:MarR family transcriptional regulator [Deinococcus ruber]GGR13734.1 MarR family transcriptional regulator [Deinococcus ruber]